MSVEFNAKGSRFNQFGKTAFVTHLPFSQISSVILVDEEVQRKRDNKRMLSIAEYILAYMKGERGAAVFNAITTSLRGTVVLYDSSTGIVRFSLRGQLHVEDGQHRCGGIELALQMAEAERNAAEETGDHEILDYWNSILEKFDDYSIPVVIFTNLSYSEEKQHFHDLNNLAVAVTSTQALHFDQADPFNQLSKALIEMIPQIEHYGIEMQAKVLSDTKKEVATLATWNYCTRIMLNGSMDQQIKRKWDRNWNLGEKAHELSEFWNHLLNVMPNDFNDRRKWMISKSVFIQGLAAWGHEIIKHDDWDEKIAALKGFDWSYENDAYGAHNGGGMKEVKDRRSGIVVGKKFQFAGTRAAINSIPKVLNAFVGIEPESEVETA